MSAETDYMTALRALTAADPKFDRASRVLDERSAARMKAADDAFATAKNTATVNRGQASTFLSKVRAVAGLTGAENTRAAEDLSQETRSALTDRLDEAQNAWTLLQQQAQHVKYLEHVHSRRQPGKMLDRLTRPIVFGAAGVALIGTIITMAPRFIGGM